MKKSLVHSRLIAIVMIIGGLVALGLAGALYYRNTQPVAGTLPSAPTESVASTDTTAVATRPASQVKSYSVPADNPKYISIPALGIASTEVLRLGLNKDKSIAVPTTAYDTGWYQNSAKPGQKGAIFVYGHVAGYSIKVDGIFWNLHNIKPGNKITITRGDNKTFTYVVNATKVYQSTNVDMTAVLNPYKPGTAGLNLMTCTGTYDTKTESFNQRLVVFSTLSS